MTNAFAAFAILSLGSTVTAFLFMLAIVKLLDFRPWGLVPLLGSFVAAGLTAMWGTIFIVRAFNG